MDSREHGRSSSSQSVSIERLVRTKSRRPGEEIEVVLSDASSFFVAMRVWEESPFHEGDAIDDREWASIIERTNLIRVRGQALVLLSRSEHSRFLLDRKLQQRGHEPRHIRPVLDELEQNGSLSDERFAVGWIRGRLRSHPEGRAHLIAGLRSRGIDAELAERAVDTALDETSTSMVENARSLVERLTRSRELPPEKIADRLYRRGFSRSIVRAVVDSLDPDD